MLQGKPAGESEEITMSAIRDILSDESRQPLRKTASKRMVVRPRVQEEPIGNLQPVKEVETKVRKASFTSVPDTDDLDNTRAPQSAEPVRKKKARKGLPELDQLHVAPTPESVVSVETQAVDAKKKAFRKVAPPHAEIAGDDQVAGTVAVQAEDAAVDSAAPQSKRTQSMPQFGAVLGKFKRRHLTLAVIAGALLMWPGLVLGAVALWILGTVAAFLTLGGERIWSAVSTIAAFYASMRPAKAAGLYAWLDSVAYRWDGVLDRFPDGSVDSLYMPDFQHMEDTKRLNKAILKERLARLDSQV